MHVTSADLADEVNNITLHSFILGLKLSFSANLSLLAFFLLRDGLHRFSGLFSDSEHTMFYFLVFMFSIFSFWFRAVA